MQRCGRPRSFFLVLASLLLVLVALLLFLLLLLLLVATTFVLLTALVRILLVLLVLLSHLDSPVAANEMSRTGHPLQRKVNEAWRFVYDCVKALKAPRHFALNPFQQ